MQELKDRIRELNTQSELKMAKNPNLWIGLLTEDWDHWLDMEIDTVDKFHEYLDECVERERRKGNLNESI